ncbi:MAG: hypothetical protein ACOVQG_02880 [Crocinitomicaceae bacterium]
MVFRLLFILAIALVGNGLIAQSFSSYQIIGNNTGLKSMSESNFKSCMKGKYNFWDNDNQVLIVLPSSNHPDAEEISKLVYSKSHTSVRKYWLSLVFQGRVASPKFCDSDEEMIDFVKSRKGAIGIVKKSAITPDIIKISIQP